MVMLKRLPALLPSCLVAHGALAATFRVTRSADLQAALYIAAVNGQGDVIGPATVATKRRQAALSTIRPRPADGDARAPRLSGGWADADGNDCALQASQDPGRA